MCWFGIWITLHFPRFGRLHHPGDVTQRVSKKNCEAAIDGMTAAQKTWDSWTQWKLCVWNIMRLMKHHNLYTTYIHWRMNLRQLTDFQPWVSTLSDFISLLLFLLHHWILSPFVSMIQTFTHWDVVQKSSPGWFGEQFPYLQDYQLWQHGIWHIKLTKKNKKPQFTGQEQGCALQNLCTLMT